MKLQVWGTSTSTCAADQTFFLALLFPTQGHKTVVLSNDRGCETYFAGDFGSALVVCCSIHAVKGLSFIVVHKPPEVLESFGH